MFDMAWMADYPDAENFLQLFYSKNISPGPNSTNFINRNYDQLYEQMLRLPPGTERDKIISQMIDVLREEMPAVFVIHRAFRLPYHGWLEGYDEYPVIYDYLQYLKVNPEKKKQLLEAL